MELHPELVKLDRQYRSLHQDVLDGNLGFEEAMGALGLLVVFDGEGNQWGINDQGEFYRQKTGSSDMELADPRLFAPTQLPQKPDASTTPPWANEDLQAPPNIRRSHTPEPGIGPLQTLTGDPHIKGPNKKITVILKEQARKLTSTNGRLVAALAIAGIVLLYLAFFVQTDDSTPVVESPPTSEAPATTDNLPQDPNEAKVPAPERISEVIKGLTSGNPDVTKTLIQTPGDASAVALETVKLDGLDEGGKVVKPGAVQENDEAANQQWVLVDQKGDSTGIQADVVWVKTDDGTWVLKTWPEFKTSNP